MVIPSVCTGSIGGSRTTVGSSTVKVISAIGVTCRVTLASVPRSGTATRRICGPVKVFASFEKRVGGNARSSPSSLSNAWWNGCWGADPCQAPAAEGGGPKARLYKGQASPATIATGGPMGCSSRPCARAQRLGGHRVTHSKFNRAILAKLIFHRRSGRRCLAC